MDPSLYRDGPLCKVPKGAGAKKPGDQSLELISSLWCHYQEPPPTAFQSSAPCSKEGVATELWCPVVQMRSEHYLVCFTWEMKKAQRCPVHQTVLRKPTFYVVLKKKALVSRTHSPKACARDSIFSIFKGRRIFPTAPQGTLNTKPHLLPLKCQLCSATHTLHLQLYRHFYFFSFSWDWGLNSELHICNTCALRLSHTSKSILLWIYIYIYIHTYIHFFLASGGSL
jgi:hypothetical protein